MKKILLTFLTAGIFVGSAAVSRAADPSPVPLDLKFSFAEKLPGHTEVTPEMAYTKEQGYGYDLGSKVSAIFDGGAHYATSENPLGFFFSAKVPEGIYKVTLLLGGDGARETVTTVKSETRRLMLEDIKLAPGQEKSYSFWVHVRVPTIPGATGAAATVRLKDREKGPVLFVRWDSANKDSTAQIAFPELDWDEKLTLCFSGAHPAVESVEISNDFKPAERPTTVYLIGDSTMTDQMMEPWAAWGQMFPRFFKEPVLIANYAECGETAASFIGEQRWAKIMSEIHAGDYVFAQFGINDRGTNIDTFKGYFVRFIDEAKAKGAIPVLVTSQNLKRLDANGKGVQTLGGFPDAMKEVAKDKDVPLIDLNEMSMRLYGAIGPANLDKAFTDGTHHSDYGAYELAKCVVQGTIDAKLPFAKNVVDDWKPFDPAKPDALADFHMMRDPQWDAAFDSPNKTSPAGMGVMAGAPPRGAGAGGARGTTAPGNRGRGPASAPANASQPMGQ